MRELQNALGRAVIVAQGGELRFDLEPPATRPTEACANPTPAPPGVAGPPTPLKDLKARERQVITDP